MSDYAKSIKPGMPVVCTDGTELGVVEQLEGENSIRLSPNEEGKNHWVPIGWVTGIDSGRVSIDRSVAHARDEWSDSNPEDL